ncbi:hypothetical protein EVAR_95745_1 [Eumeta japonica]|uniref:Uncharacterized protein n=1 Tax=Eumeta variegata TaxID=151549 RepID=A0A4C1UKV9_EUMVA|nr:hypothetical protein EVAR_95745_1 [Eumeta japonica]
MIRKHVRCDAISSMKSNKHAPGLVRLHHAHVPISAASRAKCRFCCLSDCFYPAPRDVIVHDNALEPCTRFGNPRRTLTSPVSNSRSEQITRLRC